MHIKNFFICGIFMELHWKKKKSYKVLRILWKNKIKILRKILRYITLFTCLFTFRVVTAANFQEPTQKYFDWVVDLVLARTPSDLKFGLVQESKKVWIRKKIIKFQIWVNLLAQISQTSPFFLTNIMILQVLQKVWSQHYPRWSSNMLTFYFDEKCHKNGQFFCPKSFMGAGWERQYKVGDDLIWDSWSI